MSTNTYGMTGFQSPCSEYNEAILSLDERYLIRAPSVFIVEVSSDISRLGLKAKDKLIINRALKPRRDDFVLLVVSNEFVLNRFIPEQFKTDNADEGDFIWGVVTTILRELR